MKTLALAAALVAAIASAQPQTPQPPQGGASGPRRGPPPEALKACASRKSGEACGFDSPHGHEQGSCWAPDASKPKTAEAEGQLWETAAALSAYAPGFMSVTYGAGGSTKAPTLSTVRHLLAMGLPAASHLTCVAATRSTRWWSLSRQSWT